MPAQLYFSYELIDNKIPCGGFNILGGGMKGKNLVSDKTENLIFQSFSPEKDVKATEATFLLMLNYEDTEKIMPFINDPSIAPIGKVATNLRFTCVNYYDFLKITNAFMLMDLGRVDEGVSVLKNVLNGNIVSLTDVMNLYTQRLGLKTIQGYRKTPFYSQANDYLVSFYGIDDRGSFETWLSNNVVWTIAMDGTYYRINNLLSSTFENFQLSMDKDGNVLSYFPA